MITKRLRAAGHSLAFRWSGETGAESSSTGYCTCGWSETCGSQHEVRNEYGHHLEKVRGKPFKIVDVANAAVALEILAGKKSAKPPKKAVSKPKATSGKTLYLSAAYTEGGHNQVYLMIFDGQYATDTVWADRKALIRNRDYIASVATRKGHDVKNVSAAKAREMIAGLEKVGSNVISAAVRVDPARVRVDDASGADDILVEVGRNSFKVTANETVFSQVKGEWQEVKSGLSYGQALRKAANLRAVRASAAAREARQGA